MRSSFCSRSIFKSIADQYEDKHAVIYGRFRIERITEVVEKFVLCGDYSQGIARPRLSLSRSTWARLIAQVYKVDPLICPRCSAQMRVLAVITEPEEVRKVLRHPVKIGPRYAAARLQDLIRLH